jgi:uncharacterized protein YegP (UPF0339 family)
MVTNRDDDYLICKHYYNHISDVSSEYSDFITFKHKENYYFAWVNDGKVILRSEAYPSRDKMERGIKAILNNRKIYERYSIDSQHGVHFLVLWGGGNHQKHTGNFDKHNEIGRSCPVKSKEDLYAMMGFMGKDFAKGVFGLGGISTSAKAAGVAAATTAAASLASSSKSAQSSVSKGTAKATQVKAAVAGNSTAKAGAVSSGGGFKWWYLLPLLLIPIFFMWKGCGGDAAKAVAPIKTEVSAKAKADEAAKLAAADEAKLKAQSEAKAKADAVAAKLEAEAKAKAAKAKKGSGGSAGNSRNSNNVNYRGNKNSGF